MHAMVRIAGSAVMMVDEMPEWGALGPKSLKGSPVTIHLYVEDVDAFVKRAVDAGARITMPLEDTFWGDRYCKLEDPFGHLAVATHYRYESGENNRECRRWAADAIPLATHGGGSMVKTIVSSSSREAGFSSFRDQARHFRASARRHQGAAEKVYASSTTSTVGAWSPWGEKDPAMKRTFGSVTSVKGATESGTAHDVGQDALISLSRLRREVTIKLVSEAVEPQYRELLEPRRQP